MPTTLASYLSGKSPAYGAARRKYGIAPDMLVTPPGLMPGAAFRSRRGATPNLTFANMLRTPPPAQPDMSQTTVFNQPATPAGPRFSTADTLRTAATGQQAAQNVEARSRFGTTAIPVGEQRMAFTEDRTPYMVPGLRGHLQDLSQRTLVGGARVLDPEKRQAYLGQRAGVMAGRRASVFANAQAQGQARTARLEARKRGPSFQDMLMARVAQRDPAAAANLLGLSNYRGAQLGLQGQELGLRRELGQGSLGLQEKALGQNVDLANIRSGDTRYVADQQLAGARARADAQSRQDAMAIAQTRASDPNASPEQRAAAQAQIDAMSRGQPGSVLAQPPAPAATPPAPGAAAQQAFPVAPPAAGAQQPAAPTSVFDPNRPIYYGGKLNDTQRQQLDLYRDNPRAAADYLGSIGLKGDDLDRVLNEFLEPEAMWWNRTAREPGGSWGTTVDARGKKKLNFLGGLLNALGVTEFEGGGLGQKKRK